MSKRDMKKKYKKKKKREQWIKNGISNLKTYFRSLKTTVSRYPFSFASLFLFLCFIFIIYLFLFYSAQNNPRGEKYPWFGTTIETNEGIDLICRGVYENYREGYITMYIEFEKKKENNNKIYLFSRNLPKESLEKSYLNLSKSKNKEIPMKKDERDFWYYFDLSESKSEDYNAVLRIFVGKNFYPINKERIVIHRYLRFEGFSELEEDTNIEFLYPSEWNIISCPENESVSIKESRSHRIVSEVKDAHSVKYFIEIERNYTKISLRDTKIGILLTLLFAGITLILNAYLDEKKQK